MAKSVLVSENPFVFRVFEVRTFFAEEVPLYILHIRGLSFRLLWEEDHVDCRRGISSLLFRKGNPHFKEGFCQSWDNFHFPSRRISILWKAYRSGSLVVLGQLLAGREAG